MRSAPLAAEAAPGITYADLIRQVVPDLASVTGGYAGSKLIAMSHAAPDYGGATPERFVLSTLPSMRMEIAGGPHVLLLLDLGNFADFAEGLAPLALFDLGGTPKLVDVLDVAFDRLTGLVSTGLSLSRDGLVVTTSSHFNSNQAYAIHAVLALNGAKFALVDTIQTFNEQSCAGSATQTPTFQPAGPDAFTVTVVIETAPGEAPCEAPLLAASRRDISVTYRRTTPGGDYVAETDALDVLAKANSERF